MRDSSPRMQTIPKGRPVPVVRRTVNDPSRPPSKLGMGQTVLPDNPRHIEDSSRQAHVMHNAHIKAAAAKTPEGERRRFQMSSPSPNVYGSHFPPKSSPIVRPQSAMGLTSPTTGNTTSNTYTHNYNNNSSSINNPYGKVQHQRPPTSLGIRESSPRNQQHEKQPIFHQHSRSFGDGITSEQVYTDRMPPGDVANDPYTAVPPQHYQDQRRKQTIEQNRSPLPSRGNQGGPRGSYNPYYASNLDLNSRTDHNATNDKTTRDVLSYTDGQDQSARTKRSTPAASSHDLRSAWQRLYGQGAESPVGRRPSVPPRTEEGGYQKSPRQADRSPRSGADTFNPQTPPLRMIPRGRQVAGPMVAPFTDTERQTPPGQCSTNQNAAQVSNNPTDQPASFSSPKPALKTFKPTHHESHSLGPAAKYPDPDMGLRKAVKYDAHGTFFKASKEHLVHSGQENQTKHLHKDFVESSRDVGGHFHHTAHFTHNDAYCSDSEVENEDEHGILPTDSIFDYAKTDSDDDSTLAHLDKPRRHSHHNIDPDFQRNEKGSNVVHLKDKPGPSGRIPDLKTANYARSRSLEDVRESGGESNVSFDIENTFLMVDPSDQSEMGTLRSKNSDVKTKLNRLEGMYAKVMKTLDGRSPKESSRGRRWSIGSSDTNSIRHQVHHSKHGRSQRLSNRDREHKAVNKRFQRLESHVITLARSIAHISSELRTQTTMSREIENVKKEIQELKISSTNNNNNSGGHDKKRPDFDKYRGHNHPLTNPRQVNKLTRFFGQEPSWLEIFLTRLGYEQYVKNFHQEHIGMMELPYMTDDQLKSIGIPMGPRTRILQESQMCFKDDNFNIYIV